MTIYVLISQYTVQDYDQFMVFELCKIIDMVIIKAISLWQYSFKAFRLLWDFSFEGVFSQEVLKPGFDRKHLRQHENGKLFSSHCAT